MSRKLTEEHKEKISKALSGLKKSEEHNKKNSEARLRYFKKHRPPGWKGEQASYWSIHIWVGRRKGHPDQCTNCKVKNKRGSDGRNAIHWANVDHKYKRELADYIALCAQCHKDYDAQML